MKFKTLVFLGLVQFISSANATEVCSTLADCLKLKDQVDVQIAKLKNEPPTRIAYGAKFQETVFTSDSTFLAFHEAWRDPSGMIWGDLIINDDGKKGIFVTAYSMKQAREHCTALGADLPSREDYARLRTYMGAATAASETEGYGYEPQILPNMFYDKPDGGKGELFFWTKTETEKGKYPYFFSGAKGTLIADSLNLLHDIAGIRCVYRAPFMPTSI